MPRIISIARSRPARSSVVRCSDTSAGKADLAVSVAIWRLTLSSMSVRLPGSPVGAVPARDLRGVRGSTVCDERTTWRVTLDGDDGRVRVVAAPALADAGGLAVARLRAADGGRRRADRAAAVLCRRA